MDKIKLVMTCAGELNQKILEKIDKNKFEFKQIKDNKTEDEVIEAIKDADVVYLGGDNYFSRKILESSPNLKLLSFGGIGYESYIDYKSATELGIAITNTPEANSNSVAEFAVGLLLNLQRNISYTNTEMKKGVKNRIISQDTSTQKIGIIGMGAISYRIAKILKKGFNIDVSYYNRSRKKEFEEELEIRYKSKEDLLKESDVIFIAITETPNTLNFINKKELELMKSNAIIINPARPKLINPEALYEALKNKKIKGCAMDGYYSNPNEDSYGLLELDDSTFICTANIACRTTDAWNRTDEIALQNIMDFFETGTSKNIVNPDYKK